MTITGLNFKIYWRSAGHRNVERSLPHLQEPEEHQHWHTQQQSRATAQPGFRATKVSDSKRPCHDERCKNKFQE